MCERLTARIGEKAEGDGRNRSRLQARRWRAPLVAQREADARRAVTKRPARLPPVPSSSLELRRSSSEPRPAPRAVQIAVLAQRVVEVASARARGLERCIAARQAIPIALVIVAKPAAGRAALDHLTSARRGATRADRSRGLWAGSRSEGVDRARGPIRRPPRPQWVQSRQRPS